MEKLAQGALPRTAILLLGSMLSGGQAALPVLPASVDSTAPSWGGQGEAHSCMISEPINESFCLGGYKLQQEAFWVGVFCGIRSIINYVLSV